MPSRDPRAPNCTSFTTAYQCYRSHITPLFGLLASLGVSCTDSSAEGGRTATVTDSAGITIVTNDGASTTVPSWSTEVDLAVGEVDGAPEYIFGQIADVDVDDAGNLYVLDRQAQRALVFGPDGEYLRRLAGPGEGPGELSREARDIHVASDNSIYIVDTWQFRATKYRSDGTPIQTIRLDYGRPGPFTLHHLDDGRMLVRWFTYNVDADGRLVPWDALLISDSTQTSFDTLFAFNYESPDLGILGAELQRPLIPNAAFYDVLADGQIAWSTIHGTQVATLASDGSLARIVRNGAWERHALTDAERDALEMVVQTDSDNPDEPLSPLIIFPDSLPTITALHASPDGGFWIQRMSPLPDVDPDGLFTAANTSMLGGQSWEVYNGEGRLTATVETPQRFQITRVLDSAVVGIQKDDLDIERVVRLRVIR
jgi:hypothetical protein